jgi:undecaprenyl-diphosphatase
VHFARPTLSGSRHLPPERLVCSARGGGLLQRLDRAEIGVVRRQNQLADYAIIRITVRLVNFVGNGPIYLLMIFSVIFRYGASGLSFLKAPILAILVCHSLYPFVKGYVGRERPCEAGFCVSRIGRPLDRYSFPSGHCMTLCAATCSFWIGNLYAALLFLPILFLVAWARVVSGHHYPSDTIGGALLGFSVSAGVLFILKVSGVSFSC